MVSRAYSPAVPFQGCWERIVAHIDELAAMRKRHAAGVEDVRRPEHLVDRDAVFLAVIFEVDDLRGPDTLAQR